VRPKIKFVTAVWGKDYIERFAALALPSFLALGNLPALAASADLEVVIMTREEDVATFEQHAAFRGLRSICSTSFAGIDDLITSGVYGVTLTLAYARAVIACGAEMVNTHFVFMNADFVLADGCLRSLFKHIEAGRSIVLAPSFRAIAEAVEPTLKAKLDPSGTLSISPRELVRLALPHPHPTTAAKVVNQTFCHSVHPNQFFWRVDRHTLIGRYYLIFMLCLKPERVISTINSYCDYSFIPEMCPSGNEAVMGDSDEFFMLELQRRNQEMFLVRLGAQREKNVAASLAAWTTAEHRRAATYDVVFHSEDLPPAIERAKATADAFVQKIERMLGPPRSHLDHPHWNGGVDLFLALRAEKGFPSPPLELEMLPDVAGRGGLRGRLERLGGRYVRSFFRSVYRLVMGRFPRVTPFSPYWIDYEHLRSALASVCKAPGARVLVVRDVDLIDTFVPAAGQVEFATPEEIKRRGLAAICAESKGLTDIFIYAPGAAWRAQLRYFATKYASVAERFNVATHVFIQGELTNLTGELFRYFDRHSDLPRPHSVSAAGGVLRQINRMLYDSLISQYVRFGAVAFIWIVPALIAELPLFFCANVGFRIELEGDEPFAYCSSAVIRFDNRPRPESA
jgi:hypothetical protein